MMTLEQYAIQRATELGFDTTSQTAQQAIAQGATALRDASPGTPDDALIAGAKDQIDAQINDTATKLRAAKATTAVQAPPADTGYKPSTKYSDAAAAINAEFSPEARAAVKEGTKWADVGAEAGRALSLGQRMKATPQGQAAVDAQFKEIKAGINQPMVDFETKRKQALAAMEERIKAGTADANEMRNELTRLGLEQALAERKDKAAQAAAEADPQSVTSKAMRQLALESVTDEAMRAQLQSMNAAQIKMWMPVIEKRYLKKIDDDTKRLAIADKEQARRDAEAAKKEDYAFRAGESEKDRAARLKEAGIREAGANARAAAKAGTAGAPKPLKPGEALAFSKEEGALGESLAGAKEAVSQFNELERLIKGGLSTGPIAGSETAGTVLKLLPGGDDRQKADNVVKGIVSAAAKTFGGNPTEGERRYIEEANSVMKLRDPLPRLAELRGKFEALVALRQARLSEVQQLRGAAPAARTGETTKAQYDALPSGATYVKDGVTYTKK